MNAYNVISFDNMFWYEGVNERMNRESEVKMIDEMR